MSSFELNKIVGSVLLCALILLVIGKIGDNLVGGGGHGGHEAAGPVVAAIPAAPVPAAAPVPEVPFAVLLVNGDIDRGKKVFNKCKACHTTTDGGKNGIGPNLWNVVNGVPGSREGFNYSNAMEGLSDKPWNYENLNAFLTKPKTYAKGTKMTFVGLKKAKDRANVIFFLRSLSATPAPIEQPEESSPTPRTDGWRTFTEKTSGKGPAGWVPAPGS